MQIRTTFSPQLVVMSHSAMNSDTFGVRLIFTTAGRPTRDPDSK